MAKNIETIESLLSTIPIEGPRLIITKDTKEIYYDTSNKTRILLGTSSGSGSVSEEDVEKILEKLSSLTDEDISNLIKSIWEGDPDDDIDDKKVSDDVIGTVWKDEDDIDNNALIREIIRYVWGEGDGTI